MIIMNIIQLGSSSHQNLLVNWLRSFFAVYPCMLSSLIHFYIVHTLMLASYTVQLKLGSHACSQLLYMQLYLKLHVYSYNRMVSYSYTVKNLSTFWGVLQLLQLSCSPRGIKQHLQGSYSCLLRLYLRGVLQSYLRCVDRSYLCDNTFSGDLFYYHGLLLTPFVLSIFASIAMYLHNYSSQIIIYLSTQLRSYTYNYSNRIIYIMASRF